MKVEAVIASRLREARKAAGLSQQALGVMAGIEEETAKVRIHQYEQAKHAPPFPMLEKIAQSVGKPISWFFCRDDEQELLSRLNSMSECDRNQFMQAVQQLLDRGATESL